ncbi:MAG: thiazole synthase [Candidatus Omnitrophica bacterium]|nr:thiazole synthase [Candidatus Omnitrophota bacterium]MBU2250627.1 thiazole synthase [Candidatus Omnitrophota bacterium]MBU2266212.1 thiazole synthase [Candidatus Omnitrophota bacterium]
MNDNLTLAGKTISNRLLVGTGKFPNMPVVKEVLETIQAEVVTVALRRVDIESKSDNILDYIPKNCTLMINTSGARNANEAIRIAHLAKASGCGNWIKLEVIADNEYLLPDNLETLKAAEKLVAEGFAVFPYISPDLSIAKRLAQAGVAAVMPLGSPIGSKRGVKTAELVKILIKEVNCPVIVDAGIGLPSDAAYCMEIGCAAVLVNTAIATSRNPVEMAMGFNLATRAGRLAFLNATGGSNTAEASSPLTGFLRTNE